MAALIQARISPQTAVESMTTGRRYGGADALAAGLVDATASEDAVVSSAVERLRPLAGKDKSTLTAIKTMMYRPVIDALRQGRSH